MTFVLEIQKKKTEAYHITRLVGINVCYLPTCIKMSATPSSVIARHLLGEAWGHHQLYV